MTEGEARFTECWHADSGRVAAYAARHVGADAAREVVAETFMVAWRRWETVPSPALPWLIGTARKVIANHRRAAGRRTALGQRLQLLVEVAAETPAPDSARLDALQKLARLGQGQREALLLTAWDGLSVDEASQVLGIRPATLRVRIHRARRALESPDSGAHRDPTPLTSMEEPI